MKHLFAGIFLLLASVTFAQDDEPNWGTDSLKCRQNVALYSDYLNKQEYKTSAKFWQQVLNYCPQYKSLLYKNGAYIYDKLLDEAKSDEEKQRYTDTILFAYEKLIEHFGNTAENKEDYGKNLMKYDPNQYEKAFTLMDEAIKELGDKTNLSTLQYYYRAAYYMYKYKKVDEAKMVEEYFRLTELTDNEKVLTYLDGLAEPFLKCEELLPVQQKKYDEAPEDLENLKKIAAVLEKKQCFDGDLFQIVSEKVLAQEPSAEGYYNYAILMFDKQKDREAVKNIEKALELCGDCDKQQKYIKTAAQIHSAGGSATDAYRYAQKWLDFEPNAGGAYLIMARSVASSASSCANDAFEKGMVYAIAADLAAKAKSVDESVADKANKMIGGYSSQFPTSSDVVFKGVNKGDSYTINCWINRSTTIRTRD